MKRRLISRINEDQELQGQTDRRETLFRTARASTRR